MGAETVAVTTYPYRFAWKNNEVRATLYNRRCRVLCRGTMNSALIEFENGERRVVSRNALRRVNDGR